MSSRNVVRPETSIGTILAINSGNTTISAAVFDEAGIVAKVRLSQDRNRTADEFGLAIGHALFSHGVALDALDGAILSNVAPSVGRELRTFCESYVPGETRIVGASGFQYGFEIDLDMPVGDIGGDRLANIAAARTHVDGPAIVVDIGTATTLDLMDRNGTYCGGIIAPGFILSQRALQGTAERLPAVTVDGPPELIGRSTEPAMRSGLFWGYEALMAGLLERVRREWAQDAVTIATGGSAAIFAEIPGLFDIDDPNLTLWGLKELYACNEPPSSPNAALRSSVAPNRHSAGQPPRWW